MKDLLAMENHFSTHLGVVFHIQIDWKCLDILVIESRWGFNMFLQATQLVNTTNTFLSGCTFSEKHTEKLATVNFLVIPLFWMWGTSWSVNPFYRNIQRTLVKFEDNQGIKICVS